ncbi:MAG: isoamylase early set domain-containing protein [Ilumatobacteraceae bacterium]
MTTELTSAANRSPIPVTFVFPAAAGAESVSLAGEFNEWSPDEHALERQDDDSFSITIELVPGRRYQYRYLVDGREWENDWAADAYVPNEYGGNNSQIDLTDGSERVATATAIVPGTVSKPKEGAKQQVTRISTAECAPADDVS